MCQFLRRRARQPREARVLQCPCAMTPQRISAQLLTQLDVLIQAVHDDPVLSHGLCRERERLLAHLQLTVEPWLSRQRLYPPQVPRHAMRCKHALGGRAHRRWRLQNDRQHRSRQRLCSSLREVCYIALAAEIIDSYAFDRLCLLSQRAKRPAPPKPPQASSSSPSAGLGSGGGMPSGASLSGIVAGAGSLGATSPGRPSRTYRSSVSTMRAWA